ncbi:DUF1772 domain-containing protein [Rhizobium sp. 007]|uniref:DUF1772 domain-containing protein n=1 Tax=Rhizobium sp. 007 TaxID=2785056 RepID=UPI001FEF4E24|nr:DUF1772 domain-containing protein [Rhizobium sp. 007]
MPSTSYARKTCIRCINETSHGTHPTSRSRKAPALWFAAAAVVYLVFGLLLTFTVNVPMKETLAAIAVPHDIETAGSIRRDYSERWQFLNQVRE